MPPLSWTSKWRWPSVRLAASRTVGEGLDQQVVQGLALGQPLAELGCLGAQRLVGELGELRLERVDLRHRLVEAFDDPVIGCPEQASGERAEHENLDIVMT